MSKKEFTFVSNRQKRRRIIRETGILLEKEQTPPYNLPATNSNELKVKGLISSNSSTVHHPNNSASDTSTTIYNCESDYSNNIMHNNKSASINESSGTSELTEPLPNTLCLDNRNCSISETNVLEKMTVHLREWASKFSIPQCAVNSLLGILRDSGINILTDLPSDARTLMKTPKNISSKIITAKVKIYTSDLHVEFSSQLQNILGKIFQNPLELI